ncbi:MAG: flagellar hook-associated protein FlgL [Candidatus Puniceispirillaceae bacterium]
MQVSTKLLNQQQINQFGKLNANIADAQERISTGKSILRASDDPVAAVNLSVAKEQSKLLSQFQRNIDAAETRLNITDQTLQETVNVLVRFSELSTMARNGALNEEGHLAISTEMKQLKEVLLGLANTTDANGVGIFGGYNGISRPFEMGVDGRVEYLGNRGQNHLQISENMTVATNIDGGSAFMRVDTDGTRRSLFDIVDSTINTVESASAIVSEANANWYAELDFELPSRMEEWSFDLHGSLGSANVSASINEGGLQNLVDAINAVSAQTGTTAAVSSDGFSIALQDNQNGNITIRNVQIEGADSATDQVTSYMTFTGRDGDGVATTKALKMTDSDQLISASIGNIQSAIDNLSLQRAYVGGQLSKSATQSDVIGARKLAVDKDVSRLGDADLAELVTNLQAQLTNLNAAQAAFAKIGQQSLFDYIR